MSSSSPSRSPRRYYILAALAFGAVTAVIHGGALRHGLFMDDFAHFNQLRECGWSLRGLVDACRLELVGGIIDLWWLPETTLRFFRPMAFGLMKLAYTLVGWNATAMHVVSFGWHMAACLLLLALLRRLEVPPLRAWLLTTLFAIHPGNVATVQWIACQSELMVTTFSLAAVLCIAHYRGWREYATPVIEGAARRSFWWLVAACAFFVAALGCRENAIMLPAVVAVGEFVHWRQKRGRPALWLLGLLGVIAVGYLGVRAYYLSGAALPPRPYVYPPTDPGFVRFVFDKFGYYLLGEFFLVAVVPIGGLPYLREQALVFYAGYALILAMILLLAWQHRKRHSGLLGAAWLAMFMLPVLPAFESPHHLYLPGVGWAIIMAGLLEVLGGRVGEAVRHRRRFLPGLAITLCLVLFTLLDHTYTYFALDTAQSVESRVADELATAPSGLHAGDTLYVANLPLIAHYAQLAVRRQTGIDNLRVVPLNWAPRLLGVATPSELTIIDDRTVEIAISGDRYFSGPSGSLISESTGVPLPKKIAEPLQCKDFTVQLIEQDEAGITRLRYVFHEPLSRPGVHLFWGSRTRWACEVPLERTADDAE
ncbi:MAG: hypothetical protein JXO22_15845 [Phycisphaerae bacterium]|nr:hypothetical protein [Phycisphaerae bacterium]